MRLTGRVTAVRSAQPARSATPVSSAAPARWSTTPASTSARLHDQPARPWTVAALAREVGTSRATLARRFAELVGEPPMSYLTGWRIAVACDLLADPQLTVEAVARRVGYATPFALSTAVKRVTGVSPAALRR